MTPDKPYLKALIEPTDPNDLPPEAPETVNLRYFEVPQAVLTAQLTLTHTNPQAAHQYKLEALAKLNITPAPDQPPLDAWVLQMARENNLAPTLPNPTIGHAAAQVCPAFIWFLA